jgi:predicted membrane protein
MFELSTQAMTVFWTLLIGLIISLITFGVLGGLVGILIGLAVTIISLPFLALAVYDLNCIVVGQCTIWAWVRTFFAILGVVVAIIACIMMMIYGKKEEPKKEEPKKEEPKKEEPKKEEPKKEEPKK